MCIEHCDSLWRHDSFEHFKRFIVPPQTTVISATTATRSDFYEPDRIAMNYNVLGNFAKKSKLVAVRRKNRDRVIEA